MKKPLSSPPAWVSQEASAWSNKALNLLAGANAMAQDTEGKCKCCSSHSQNADEGTKPPARGLLVAMGRISAHPSSHGQAYKDRPAHARTLLHTKPQPPPVTGKTVSFPPRCWTCIFSFAFKAGFKILNKSSLGHYHDLLGPKSQDKLGAQRSLWPCDGD